MPERLDRKLRRGFNGGIWLLRILLVEPFFGGSHKYWAERIRRFSRHDWDFLTLDARYWKWRMRGGAVILGQRWEELDMTPELIVASSMLDLPTFIATVAKKGDRVPPFVLYAHENQFLYPIPEDRPVYQQQRMHFGAMNWRSALLADHIIYNSEFHKESATKAYEDFVRRAPDHREAGSDRDLRSISSVHPPAPDLEALDENVPTPEGSSGKGRTILWNHRWEREKGPAEFVDFVERAIEEGHELRLILAGPSGGEERRRRELAERYPERTLLAEEIESSTEYMGWLHAADFIFSSSHQDFFGLSVVEAMYCHTVPILPDRLAYPEHLTPALKRLLYRDTEEAQRILGHLMKEDLGSWKQEARNSVAPYDIRNWIDRFDDRLEAVRDGGLP